MALAMDHDGESGLISLRRPLLVLCGALPKATTKLQTNARYCNMAREPPLEACSCNCQRQWHDQCWSHRVACPQSQGQWSPQRHPPAPPCSTEGRVPLRLNAFTCSDNPNPCSLVLPVNWTLHWRATMHKVSRRYLSSVDGPRQMPMWWLFLNAEIDPMLAFGGASIIAVAWVWASQTRRAPGQIDTPLRRCALEDEVGSPPPPSLVRAPPDVELSRSS